MHSGADGLPPRAPAALAGRYGPDLASAPYHRPPPPALSPPPGPPVALAYHEPKRPIVKSTAWKVWMVLGDCTLIGLAPVLVQLAKDSGGHYAFSPVAVNLLVESFKTLFALGTLVAYGTGRPGPPMYRNWRTFVRDARHNRLLVVPAALYAINNYLKFAMQLFFKPTTAKMLSNLKILVIAVLMRFVLRRSFNVFQWEALLLLVAGITVNQLNYCSKGSGGDLFSPASIMYTLGSITVPSLASVYAEFALKKHMDTSVLLQNFFLYFFGMCFNVLGLLFVMLVDSSMRPATLLHGFRSVTFLLVVNNALQGILSSFFFKYADSILKKQSSTIATIFTGLMSAALFGHALTLNFAIGVSIVFISMHLFFSMGSLKGGGASTDHKGPPPPPARLAVSPSMEHFNLSAVQSSASMASLTSAAAGEEGAALLGGGGGVPGGAAMSRVQALLPR
ncbi:CMP-sialic acid transporter 3-like [Micractinium conductrix]|uniref:CMP-sialic acid transporter 3-like n=1 Tax=Micractinium conductrix TaxID=554055 RepID=A0A2P6VNW2_9CHLO|nr:CMP-sialic acid transporter 3-like [Micractinium conductrix]|eukprot:PSC75788.1 CMP-sialic acid transporter 3-like [Micractinium conductrix]